MSRALRILLVANDGLSAGHVTRTLAIARALRERGPARSVPVQLVLATTSEADALLAQEPIALVRMPAPVAGRRAGLSDSERRRLVRGCIESVATSFGPDVIVVDTFPSGPHGELTGLVAGRASAPGEVRAKMVLVRRDVPADRAAAEELAAGLAAYDLALLAADPTPLAEPPVLPNGRCVHVPPIVRGGLLARDEARAALGIAADAHAVLVTAGGGGDADALARADRIAASIAALSPSSAVVHARGPLAGVSLPQSFPGTLGGVMAAFDGAFAAAGYNTAHELARAGVPAALFASPRSFDDQRERARRFERAGLAFELESDDDDAIAHALGRIARASRPALVADGAGAAAHAILDLVAAPERLA